MDETINIGLTLMIIGMSVVFIFLAVMIVVINISSKVIQLLNKYFPEETTEPEKPKTDKDAEIALAIACAMRRKKQG